MNHENEPEKILREDQLQGMGRTNRVTVRTVQTADGRFATYTSAPRAIGAVSSLCEEYASEAAAIRGHVKWVFHESDFIGRKRLYADTVEHGQFLIYRKGSMIGGIIKEYARNVLVLRAPHAQHPEAIHLYWQTKHQRTRVNIEVFPRGPLLILSGWDHDLDPDAPFLPPETSATGTQLSRSRYLASDPRWKSDFIALSDAYLARIDPDRIYLDARDYPAENTRR